MPAIGRDSLAFCAIAVALQVWLAADAHAASGRDVAVASWTIAEGAAPEVRAIARDSAGYLWLGTAAGLLRFDGTRFVHADELFNQTGLATPVYSLLIASDGVMWIGFGPRGGVGRLSPVGRTYTEYTAQDGIPDGSIRTIWEGRDRQLWAGGYGGLSRFRDGKWRKVRAGTGFPEATVNAVREDRDGHLIVATDVGTFRWRPTTDAFERLSPVQDVAALADSGDAVWMAGATGGLARVGGPIDDKYQVAPALKTLTEVLALTSSAHEIWIGTDGQGLFRASATLSPASPVEQFRARDGLTSDTVLCLFNDPEGALWVGTENGLNRLLPLTTTLRAGTPFENAYVAAMMAAADGALWVGTNAGLFRLEESRAVRVPFLDAHPRTEIRGIQDDGAGGLWVAAPQGIAHLENGRATVLDGIAEDRLTRLTALGLDARGRLLIGDFEGLFLWNQGSLETIVHPDSGRGRPGAILKDRSNRVWVGFSLGDIALVEDNGIRWFTARDGLRPGGVNAFHEDQAGTIWVATNAGLSRWTNGRFVTFTREHGLPDASIRAVVSDSAGTLWIGGNSGIVGLSPAELDHAATDAGHKIRYRLLDFSDGLEGVVTRRGLPNSVRRADGTLWFATTRGISVLTPQTIAPPSEPRIRIERVVADQQALTPAESVRLPALTRRLEITYASINLLTPHKTRLRYRLDGFDNTWTDAGQARQAVYANLKPGSYRFVVSATQGQLAESTASVAIIVPPLFYQTTWFYALCTAVGSGAAIGLWRRRLKTVHTRYALVLAERSRLAREIHDTLLQGMVGVGLQLHVMLERLDSSADQLRRPLTQARESLEHHIREARRSILDLRSPTLEHTVLSDALRRTAHELTAWSQTDVRFVLSGNERRYERATEEQLLRIGQEAISNAVQHANAGTISVELSYADDGVLLKVSDDGAGFDPESETVKHWGLRSMKERAQQIGAVLKLASSALGTSVEVWLDRPHARAEERAAT